MSHEHGYISTFAGGLSLTERWCCY